MASYAESMLTAHERVVARQRQHWLAVILDSRLGLLLWGIAILLIVVRFLFVQDGGLEDLLIVGFAIAVAGGLVVVAVQLLQWRNVEFVVTNRRLLSVSGIVNKRSSGTSLEKINDALLQVNLLGRLLDYGDLDILTASSESGVDRFRMLRHAKEFKKEMLTAKHALETDSSDGVARAAPAAPRAAPPPSIVAGGEDPLRADTPEEITEVLSRLAGMRDAGHISPEDYEAKKQELLDRL
jgi:hypothetical protein